MQIIKKVVNMMNKWVTKWGKLVKLIIMNYLHTEKLGLE
jgi:hypothetical protein